MVTRRALLAACGLQRVIAQVQKGNMFGNAESYERFMGRWSRLAAPLLVDYAGVDDRGSVLDVGSGTGALAFAIAETKRGVRVTGIDPSQEYVAYASSKNRFSDRVAFQVGDAQRLPFTDGTYAASVSLLVFNFIPDAAKALAEVRRVTQSGGVVSAAVWDYGGRMDMLRAFWDAATGVDSTADKLDEKHMPLCRAGHLASLWKQGGMKDVEERALEITMQFASFADYWEPFLLGQGPAGAYVRSRRADLREALREAVKARLRVRSETDALNLPARVWAVKGTVPGRRL